MVNIRVTKGWGGGNFSTRRIRGIRKWRIQKANLENYFRSISTRVYLQK